MPPRFRTTRDASLRASIAAWNAGASGAPLATRCKIAATEIGDGRNPGELRDDVRIAELQRVWRRAERAMAHGLSMRANRGHGSRRRARTREQGIGGSGEISRNLDIERAKLVQRNAAIALRQRKDALAQIIRIRVRQRRVQSGLRIEARQSDINAVGAGA